MKEEELIKKLESVELPEIELQSHRRRLRTALLNAGYLQKQRKVAILKLAKSKLKGGIDIMIRGLVSRQPVWKTAVVSILVLALVIGLSLTIPSLSTKPVYAQAAEIAQKSPQVRAALGGGDVQVVKVIKVVGDKGTVICQGELGIIIAEVDVKTKEVTAVSRPKLTEADKQKAIDIAKADPRVQELLNKGASITKVSPMYSFVTRIINTETGEIEEFTEELVSLVSVEITLGETTIWVAHVDLAEGKVVGLEEITLRVITPPGGKMEPPAVEKLTEADEQKAIDIAKADPRVQELLNKGASIIMVAPMYSFGTRIINEETGETEEFTDDLVRVEIALGETVWVAYVDLVEGKVVGLKVKEITLEEGCKPPPGIREEER